MSWKWVAESPGRWDTEKTRIIQAWPKGIFAFESMEDGQLAPGQWWHVEDESGAIVGYGWMDCSWGEAEVLLVVDPDQKGTGIGSFILDHLQKEARKEGYRYIINDVKDSHPDPQGITDWLKKQGFEASSEGRLLRRDT